MDLGACDRGALFRALAALAEGWWIGAVPGLLVLAGRCPIGGLCHWLLGVETNPRHQGRPASS